MHRNSTGDTALLKYLAHKYGDSSSHAQQPYLKRIGKALHNTLVTPALVKEKEEL